jgi:hypothetical protein
LDGALLRDGLDLAAFLSAGGSACCAAWRTAGGEARFERLHDVDDLVLGLRVGAIVMSSPSTSD